MTTGKYISYILNWKQLPKGTIVMKILVINAGSSSLKYQLIDTDNEAVLAKGNCERIGQNGAFIGFKHPTAKNQPQNTDA